MLTVAQLIEILSGLDQSAIVMVDGFDGYGYAPLEDDMISTLMVHPKMTGVGKLYVSETDNNNNAIKIVGLK